MSVQTGTPSIPHGPPSSRTMDRARHVVKRARNNPNPIWIRELRQSARLHRTPIILMIVTMLVALLLVAVGGLMTAASKSPATVGVTLFHVFFSVAFFIVTLLGPGLAANSIASEREGRTWEPLLLTGLSTRVIARGKFLAVFTSMSLYVIVLLPVGALPFLFGGVTALEVAAAFLLLALITLLSVTFGLALSAAMPNGRVAILIALLVSFVTSITAFSSLGVGLSVPAHSLWPGVVSGAPVWLPTAYGRAPFSLEYVVYLIAIPLATLLTPSWFFYEVMLANLAPPTDDRITGLKRWFTITTPLLALASSVPLALVIRARDVPEWSAVIVSSMVLFATFAVLLFQGDALGPSRKVVTHWRRRKAGALTRFFGPGLLKSMVLVTLTMLGTYVLILAAGAANLLMSGLHSSKLATSLHQLGWIGVYSITTTLFAVALGSWIRTKTSSIGMARFLFVVATVVIAAVPWIVGILYNAITSTRDSWWLASLSPLYLFRILFQLGRASPDMLELLSGGVAVVFSLLISGGLLVAARIRARRAVKQYEDAHRKTDELLAREDAELEQSQHKETGRATDGPLGQEE